MNSIHPKVSVAALGGALVGVTIYEAKRHGFEIDAVEGSYLTLLVTTTLGFFIPADSQADTISVPPGSSALVETPIVPPPTRTAVVHETLHPEAESLDIPPRPSTSEPPHA